jgi:hypothetical protein
VVCGRGLLGGFFDYMEAKCLPISSDAALCC